MRFLSNTIKFSLGTFIILASLFVFSSSISAHGYVNEPKSRALLCAEGANNDCGSIIYEPQSLEAPGNFPEEGPPDGKIASANIFHELDEQASDRWAKVPIASGPFTFEWTLTAAHATAKWDYYITKEGWNPNEPLKRSDFEKFCTVNDNGARPPFTVNHDCVIPDRTGYHVILAYWEVADTANAFYNVIDVDFDGDYVEPGNPGEPEEPNPEQPAAWDANKVYLGGDSVTYNGAIYEAKWWTQNEIPGEADVWHFVRNIASGEQGNKLRSLGSSLGYFNFNS
ncbi:MULTISPECIES: lytic polysaccharide monooxygenase [Clostridia]|uniref:lytic polysaccharide monooxygenase n=1 Tax=Clostridia TaxID=186801 RepID=UPI000EA0D6CE|nr:MULTISPECIES: lytic polysaccharide monooxygenase [Clostridia]NBJ70832.1 chitin-binding protein [Roseburia sp. 1XD42-34]RKI75695.1 chitin-binding protein [Clostridium sp. 1xD42-85]